MSANGIGDRLKILEDALVLLLLDNANEKAVYGGAAAVGQAGFGNRYRQRGYRPCKEMETGANKNPVKVEANHGVLAKVHETDLLYRMPKVGKIL